MALVLGPRDRVCAPPIAAPGRYQARVEAAGLPFAPLGAKSHRSQPVKRDGAASTSLDPALACFLDVGPPPAVFNPWLERSARHQAILCRQRRRCALARSSRAAAHRRRPRKYSAQPACEGTARRMQSKETRRLRYNRFRAAVRLEEIEPGPSQAKSPPKTASPRAERFGRKRLYCCSP